MTYPYYEITGHPIIDSLFVRKEWKESDNLILNWVLSIALIGFGLAFIGGYNFA